MENPLKKAKRAASGAAKRMAEVGAGTATSLGKGRSRVKQVAATTARTGRDMGGRAGRVAVAAGDAAVTIASSTAQGIKSVLTAAYPLPSDQTPTTLKKTDVFIVHGHDEQVLQEVQDVLRSWGLNPISLKEQAGALMTIKEKFEKHAYSPKVGFALALFTPDDECTSGSDGLKRKRARQNVLFELGFFLSAFSGKRACMIVKGDIELPSDLDGVSYIDFQSPGWQSHLKAELSNADVPLAVRRAAKNPIPTPNPRPS